MPGSNDDTIPKRLGATIKNAREARRWSQQTVADRLDTSKNYVGQLERGERLPSIPTLAELARLLGFSTDAVILGSSDADARRFAAQGVALFGSVPEDYRPLALDFLRLLATRKPPEARTGKRRGRVIRSRTP